LESEVQESEERIDQQVQSAADDIALLTDRAVEQVGDIGKVSADLSRLETALFGFAGARVFENDLLRSIEKDIETMRSYFNDALWHSFNSFERALSNDYIYRYTV
jgi:hypothetical protein